MFQGHQILRRLVFTTIDLRMIITLLFQAARGFFLTNQHALFLTTLPTAPIIGRGH